MYCRKESIPGGEFTKDIGHVKSGSATNRHVHHKLGVAQAGQQGRGRGDHIGDCDSRPTSRSHVGPQRLEFAGAGVARMPM